MRCHLAREQGRRWPSLSAPREAPVMWRNIRVNRTDPPKRSTDMTKSQRPRSRDVIELVDEPLRPGSPAPDVGPALADSFEDFYRRELPRLLVLARALAGDVAAEDIAQESMLTAYRRWSRISQLSSPVGYVRGICAHQA